MNVMSPTAAGSPTAAMLGTSEAVDRIVSATVNAPYRRTISAKVLADCIAGAALDDWLVHVATFFTDVTPEFVVAFSAAHGIPEVKIAETYMAVKTRTGERSLELESVLGLVGPPS